MPARRLPKGSSGLGPIWSLTCVCHSWFSEFCTAAIAPIASEAIRAIMNSRHPSSRTTERAHAPMMTLLAKGKAVSEAAVGGSSRVETASTYCLVQNSCGSTAELTARRSSIVKERRRKR